MHISLPKTSFIENLVIVLSIFVLGEAIAQSQQTSYNRELHYKFRDGNRWEGIKLREWQQVSGTLELTSLVCYEDGWRQIRMAEIRDSVSIFVYAPLPRGISVSVFDLDKSYFMDPYPQVFGKSGRNTFTWPSKILGVLRLPINQLDGIAKARIENRVTYLPIYFLPPDKIRGNLVAEFCFLPSRTATFDFALYANGSEQPVWVWNDIRIEANMLKPLYWKLETDLNRQTDFTLVAMEKATTESNLEFRRNHVFNIFFFR